MGGRALLVLGLIGLGLRLPALALPLEGEAAELASRLDALGRGGGLAGGAAPLLLLVLAPLGALGLHATLSVRLALALSAAAVAPVLVGRFQRHGMPEAGRIAAGLFLLLPLFPLGLGGAFPALEAPLLLLLLVSAPRKATPPTPRAHARRLLTALALPGIHPAGALYALAFLGPLREPALAWWKRAGVAAAFVALVALVPGASPLTLAPSSSRAAVDWLLAAGLGTGGLVLVALCASLRPPAPRHPRLVPTSLLLLGAAHLALVGTGYLPSSMPFPVEGALVFVLFLLPAARAFLARGAESTLRLLRPLVVAGALATVVLCLPPVARWVLPTGSLADLSYRAEAMRIASAAAGPGDLIFVDVLESKPAARRSLGDLAGGVAVAGRGGEGLVAFRATDLPLDRTLLWIAEAGRLHSVQPLGGVIFRLKIVAQAGPYAVLRARRE